MAIKTGVVENVARSGKAVQIDGEWYSAFTAGQLNGANAGDEVKLTYKSVEKGGTTYHNIQGNVSVSARSTGAAAPAAAEAAPSRPAASGGFVKGGRSFPVGALDPERSIIRQNALTQANKLFETLTNAGFGAAAPMAGDFAKQVIEVARIFEGYSAGDIDAAEAADAIAEMKATMAAKE